MGCALYCKDQTMKHSRIKACLWSILTFTIWLSMRIGTGYRVFLAWSPITQFFFSVGIQSAGDPVPKTLWVRILHSAEEDNLSPSDSKIACLCQSIAINNNKNDDMVVKHIDCFDLVIHENSFIVIIIGEKAHGPMSRTVFLSQIKFDGNFVWFSPRF